MRKQIGNLIPMAVEAIRKHLLMDTKDGSEQVNEAYGGYAAAYASTIEQCGLLVATAMFSDQSKTDRTKGDKTCLMRAIHHVIKKDTPAESEHLFSAVNKDHGHLMRRNILDAAIAIKLALRTFKECKPEKKP